MERIAYKRPTTHYDERIKQIDEKICELINQRKNTSDNNPGYPPFEYISNWAEKFNLYEDLLKSVFGSLWNEKMYTPLVKPEGFRMNLPVLKSREIDNRLFSIMAIRQYSNSSVVNFNIDWDNTGDKLEYQSRHVNFELLISEQYECWMSDGCGGGGHFHYNFIVSPPLPDNLSGIELIFKEFEPPFTDKQIGGDIVIQL
ncbi:hypothetical protein CLPUN_31160 [Clostridium puniceum]|uniref:Uncharacterized protein n=1 Tax=Clostridium puniceum TaxID=29367 RepID=A0A1S8TDG1_9CLOT|nr:hypothetical protein [Clostridium puniceum]OOM75651.1 hypothetical protein CLPUN_31160 [Clostridium puniceum]